MKDDIKMTLTSKYLYVNAVAERAKSLQAGARPLLDHGNKLVHPIDIAIEEMKRGLVRIDAEIEKPLSLISDSLGAIDADEIPEKAPSSEAGKKKKKKKKKTKTDE